MIILKNLEKKYESGYGVFDISFHFEKKGFYLIKGESGSGKSTLLNVLGLLDNNTNGEFYFDNHNLSTLNQNEIENLRNEKIGFVYQDFSLLENLTVKENLQLVCNSLNIPHEEINKVLKALGIDELADKLTSKLSSGQKQRVSIARAIIKKPKVLLADEPTGNLDSQNSKAIFNILKELSKDILVICVSHEDVSSYADYTLNIKDGRLDINESIKEPIVDKSKNILKSKVSFKNIFIESSKLYNNAFLSRISSTFILIFLTTLFVSMSQIGSFSTKKLLLNEIEESSISKMVLNDHEFGTIDQEGNYNGINFLNIDNYFSDIDRYYSISSNTDEDLFVTTIDINNYDLVSGYLPTSNNEIAISDYLNNKLNAPTTIKINSVDCTVVGIYKTPFVYNDNEIINNDYFKYTTNVVLTSNYLNFFDRTIKTFDFINTFDFTERLNKNLYMYSRGEYQNEILYGREIQSKNEIIINERFLTRNGKPSTYYLDKVVNLYDIYDYNDLNDRVFSLSLNKEVQEVKIVGICSNSSSNTSVYLHNDLFDSMYNIYLNYFENYCFVIDATKENLNLVFKYNYGVSINDADTFYSAALVSKTTRAIGILFSVIIFIILVLYLVHEISHFIKDNKRNLFILSGIGISKKEIEISINTFYYFVFIIAYFISTFLSKLMFDSLNRSFLNVTIRSTTVYFFQTNLIVSLAIIVLLLLVVSISIFVKLKGLRKNSLIKWSKTI